MEQITHPFVRKSVFTGVLDRNLKKIESRLGVELATRGDSLTISGPPEKVAFARFYFERIGDLEAKGHDLREEDFQIILDLLEQGRTKPVEDYLPTEPLSFARKSVSPKSLNQQEYIQAIRTHDLVFGVGPAGTGKTYLAMAMALTFLQNKIVSRIILTRPAVEAGERLGFLPGDMIQKVNPYLRPLYDALFDMVSGEQAQRLIDKNIIEIAPLAYMRGRTLNSAFIILDEAQNTTRPQMKMFLTRAGYDSKVIVTADITQIDLPHPKDSGVLHALKILAPIKEIAICKFDDRDVVRHPLVQKIVKAYQKAETRDSD
jgi:phosphate starvation-inducible PhoH-like protein